MTMDEIKARKAEIETEMSAEEITEERLAELEVEVDSLNSKERAIIEAAEARKKLEEAVKSKGIEKEIETKEIKKMVDYRSAFLKNLQGKELDVEERQAVNASAAIPTETMDMVIGKLEGSPIFNASQTVRIPFF